MRILLVEDEQTLAQSLKQALERDAFVVDHAADGEEGQFLGVTEPYDAVVLDLGLPIVDGLSILRAWRAQGLEMPVLILTARSDWTDKVSGLDAGADDYLAKPFQVEELLARLRALIRRSVGQAQAELTCGDVVLDTRRNAVSKAGMMVTLTAQELRVLSYLMHHMGQTISKTTLTEHIYDQDFDRDSNTIEVFIARLRPKLGKDLIKTERGLGYRIEPGSDAAHDVQGTL